MNILDCSCGHKPTVESNPGTFQQWDMFCFHCKRHSTCHPSKQNAIRAWNAMVVQEIDARAYPKAG